MVGRSAKRRTDEKANVFVFHRLVTHLLADEVADKPAEKERANVHSVEFHTLTLSLRHRR